MDRDEREPPLDDMLADPTTQALMASDRVAPAEIRFLLGEARQRYAAARSRLRGG